MCAATEAMFTSQSQHWCSPEEVVDAVAAFYGEITLDPASNPYSIVPAVESWGIYREYDELDAFRKRESKKLATLMPASRARRERQIEAKVDLLAKEIEAFNVAMETCGITVQDALARLWQQEQAVCGYINPPYNDVSAFMEQLCLSARDEDQWIALVVARTSSRWFKNFVFDHATAICFVDHRLKMLGAAGSAPFDSVLIYYGDYYAAFVDHFTSMGTVLLNTPTRRG